MTTPRSSILFLPFPSAFSSYFPLSFSLSLPFLCFLRSCSTFHGFSDSPSFLLVFVDTRPHSTGYCKTIGHLNIDHFLQYPFPIYLGIFFNSSSAYGVNDFLSFVPSSAMERYFLPVRPDRFENRPFADKKLAHVP